MFEIEPWIEEAVNAGLIMKHDNTQWKKNKEKQKEESDSKRKNSGCLVVETGADIAPGLDSSYTKFRFLHDSIQQATYTLISEGTICLPPSVHEVLCDDFM